jgi:hypothetical protein
VRLASIIGSKKVDTSVPEHVRLVALVFAFLFLVMGMLGMF